MKPEVEAKFLAIDLEELRQRLRDMGATCVTPMRLMKRAIIDHPDRRLAHGEQNSYVRVRDEGDRVTITYKRFSSFAIDGAHEIEVEVNSFDDAIRIFTEIGLIVTSMQETKRETWKYQACEIVLDEWPWLAPYLEIEADDESVVRAAAKRLGLLWKDAVFGDVMVAYRAQYPHLTSNETIGDLPVVAFGTPAPSFLTRNASSSD